MYCMVWLRNVYALYKRNYFVSIAKVRWTSGRHCYPSKNSVISKTNYGFHGLYFDRCFFMLGLFTFMLTYYYMAVYMRCTAVMWSIDLDTVEIGHGGKRRCRKNIFTLMPNHLCQTVNIGYRILYNLSMHKNKQNSLIVNALRPLCHANVK